MPTLGGVPRVNADYCHPLYLKYRDIWRFYELSYHGGKDYLNPDILVEWLWVNYVTNASGVATETEERAALNSFLFPYSREKPAFYQQRKRRSWYRNLCKPTLNVVRDHALGDNAERKAAGCPAVEAMWEDVDLMGSDIKAWIKEGMTKALVMGHQIAVADLVRILPGEIRTLKDEQDLGVRPYGTWYSPLQMPYWEVDRFGGFNVVCLLEEDLRQNRGEDGAPLWRMLYRDHWEIREGGPEGEIVDEGENPLGRVPIEILRTAKLPGVRDPLGESFLEAIAPINQQIYNTDSMRDELKYRQGPFLAIPGGKGLSAAEIGLEHAFAIPEGASLPQWVTMPAEQHTMYSDEIAEMVLAIRALAGLSRGSGEQSIAARSGEALLQETQDKRALLKGYRGQVEDFENRWAQLVADVAGQVWDGSVKYSDKIMTKTFMEEIDEATKFLDLPMPDKAKKEVVNALVRQRLAHLPLEEIEELLAEPKEAGERPNITLAPTDAAKVIEGNEARSSMGLSPHPSLVGKFLADMEGGGGSPFGAPPKPAAEEAPEDADVA